MSSNPLITIVVPIYNVEKYIDRCIESIVAQTYENIEIILVDDGSTDNSGIIADQYRESYNNIRVIHKRNEGLSSARNIGIEKARGEWISFIDSDDYIEANYISHLLLLAQTDGSDIATCNYNRIDQNGKILKQSFNWTFNTLCGEEAVDNTFKHIWPSYIWLNLFKTSLFKENNIRFPEGRTYEDLTTKIETLSCAKKVSFSNKKLYNYTARKQSITNNRFSKKTYEDKIEASKEIQTFAKKHDKEICLFSNYYRYCIVNSVLNEIAKRESDKKEAKIIWRITRERLFEEYPNVKFPNIRTKAFRSTCLFLSLNKHAYCALYELLFNK